MLADIVTSIMVYVFFRLSRIFCVLLQTDTGITITYVSYSLSFSQSFKQQDLLTVL